MDFNPGWIALGLIAALGGAGVTLFGRIGLEGVNATLVTTLRSLIMALVMLLVALFSGQFGQLTNGQAHMTGRAWLFIVLAGLSGAASWLAYFAALKIGPAAGVAALDRLSLAFIFLLGVLLFKDPHTWRGWLGVVILMAGIYLVASDH